MLVRTIVVLAVCGAVLGAFLAGLTIAGVAP